MKNWAFSFLMIAFVAGIFGFMPAGMIPVAVAGVARILFPIFLGLGVVAFLASLARRNPTAS
jgi:uncharacterized membrane protein YtjA (UPF0391 family)